jgi:hypothetical protein
MVAGTQARGGRNTARQVASNLDPITFLNSIENVASGDVVCVRDELFEDYDVRLLKEEYGDVITDEVGEALKVFCNGALKSYDMFILLYDKKNNLFEAVVGREIGKKYVIPFNSSRLLPYIPPIFCIKVFLYYFQFFSIASWLG